MVRALLTAGERDAVRGDDEMADNTRSSHISRVRRKIQRLREDAELLHQHHPEIYESLQEAVCERELEARLDHLEGEVNALSERVEALEHGEGSNNNTDDNTDRNKRQQ